jgi:hypothetical protein
VAQVGSAIEVSQLSEEGQRFVGAGEGFSEPAGPGQCARVVV